MSGLKSRRKGMYNEYLCRDILRAKGWKADRVPSSGSANGFKHDIHAEKNGTKITVEVKSRSSKTKHYNTVYDLHALWEQGGAFSMILPEFTVAISNDFEKLLDINRIFHVYDTRNASPMRKNGLRKFYTLYKECAGATIMAIKTDRKGFLWLKFYPEVTKCKTAT